MVYPRSLFPPSVYRLRVTPDEPSEGPPAITEQRPRGSRRPHTDMVVAKVRHLFEHTDLTYRQIAAKTGIRHTSISNWARDGAWQRPSYALRARDMVPDRRAGPRLKQRRLAGRLQALAERYARELEEAPRVEVETLIQALQVLKMARLQAQGGRRGHRVVDAVAGGAWKAERDKAITTALKEMRRGGVDIERAPKEAVEMLIEANTPREDVRKLRLPRGGRRRSRTL